MSQVAGLPVGKVNSISLDGNKVLITFDISDDVHVGDRSEAEIKTKTLLGAKALNITTRGDADLSGPIPLERTHPAYQLADALGELSSTVNGLNTDQLNQSLTTLAQTFSETPDNVKLAVDGVARISQTLDERDSQLRDLLANANKATTVLADRTQKIVGLVRDTDALLVALQSQSSALDHISANVSALARQLSGFIDDNRAQLKPALDKLNGALTIIDNRKADVQSSIKKLNSYAMSLGESVASAPFFKAYLANLLPGQFIQPFVDAAFSDLGLDPHTLPPSQMNRPADRTARHPGSSGALPTHRPRRPPQHDAARRDHRQARRSGMRPARLAVARPDRLLPVPRAGATRSAGRSAAGSAGPAATGSGVHARANPEAAVRAGTRRSAARPACRDPSLAEVDNEVALVKACPGRRHGRAARRWCGGGRHLRDERRKDHSHRVFRQQQRYIPR